MKWRILDTGPSSALKNMEIDSSLLDELKTKQEPILHLYEFENEAATFGHFIHPYSHLKEEGVQKRGLQLAKRPTGGGILFHLWDFTFSLLIPSSHPAFSLKTLDNYARVNTLVGNVLAQMCGKIFNLYPSNLKSWELGKEVPPNFCPERVTIAGRQGTSEDINLEVKPTQPKTNFSGCLGIITKETVNTSFCMASPTIFDILWEGRKIGGAAQRRTKFGFLHQGSISLIPPSEEYLREVLKDDTLIPKMRQNSAYLAKEKGSIVEIKERLKTLLTKEINHYA